ncbi:MAG: NAD(P)-dependent oxidoreductase [Pseudomonadota bacterium]
MNKYLLIGGNGVIGHFLARQLVRAGHRPVIMSRRGDTALLADIEQQCDHVRGDMADAQSVNDLVREHQITHIAHLGAVLPSVSEVEPAVGIRLNVEGTAHVLDAAKRNGVKRVVMASSKAAYGPARGEHAAPRYLPVAETMLPEPNTVYGITKYASEMLGNWYARTHGIEFAALRFGATIGPGKIERHGGTFSRYSVIIEHGMAGIPVEISKDADALCDALYNDDAARGILLALSAPRLSHTVYNIASGTGFSLRDLANAVQRRYPQAVFSITPDAPGTQPGGGNVILDASRARADLGFEANPDVDHIVEAYVQTMQLLGLKAGG